MISLILRQQHLLRYLEGWWEKTSLGKAALRATGILFLYLPEVSVALVGLSESLP